METLNQPGTVSFPCPKCQETTIMRSRHDRKIAAQYTCKSCGFTGPN